MDLLFDDYITRTGEIMCSTESDAGTATQKCRRKL